MRHRENPSPPHDRTDRGSQITVQFFFQARPAAKNGRPRSANPWQTAILVQFLLYSWILKGGLVVWWCGPWPIYCASSIHDPLSIHGPCPCLVHGQSMVHRQSMIHYAFSFETNIGVSEKNSPARSARNGGTYHRFRGSGGTLRIPPFPGLGALDHGP